MPNAKSQPVPPLAERQKAGLSETLRAITHPLRCQSCGAWGDDGPTGQESNAAHGLTRWIECDAWDQPTPVVVILCESCSNGLVKQHARLYNPLRFDQPVPGTMLVCCNCRHRDGVRCTSPNARANGGAGVRFDFETPPSKAHINYGGGHGEFVTLYGRISRCHQHEKATPEVAR